MIHVALLRGINVGGKNTVPMAQLRGLCDDLGWTGVATYINSGNVVFNAEPGDHAAMAAALAESVGERFGFGCRVLVKPGDDVVSIASAIPDHWSNGGSMKADVVYLMDGLEPHQVREALGPRDGIDTVEPARGALLWMVERSNVTRSSLQRIVGTKLYQQVTIRNVNTARRLAAMVEEHGGGGGIRTHGRG